MSTTNAGIYALTLTPSLTLAGYTFRAGTSPVNYTISKAPLTVTASNASKIYGDAVPALTSVVSGFVGGESLATSGVTGAGVATTTATTATPVGTAVITSGAGNLAAGNYSFNLVNGTLTVTSASVPDSDADAVKRVLDQVAGLSSSKAGAGAASLDLQIKPEPLEKSPSAENTVMGSNQTQAQSTSMTAPTPVAAPVALARSGVLAVTILQGGEGNTTLASVAFEQNQTTTSIEASAPPSVLFKAAKVEFTDKLTTFMVAAANGEMVEFQGGTVNNRMFIMAPSVEAKRVAQYELNLVLAAAIISLGKENRIMLAQLDGVVLDLR